MHAGGVWAMSPKKRKSKSSNGKFWSVFHLNFYTNMTLDNATLNAFFVEKTERFLKHYRPKSHLTNTVGVNFHTAT